MASEHHPLFHPAPPSTFNPASTGNAALDGLNKELELHPACPIASVCITDPHLERLAEIVTYLLIAHRVVQNAHEQHAHDPVTGGLL